MWMHLLVICAAMNCVLGSSFPGVVGRVGNGKYTTFDGRSGRLKASNITILDTSDGFLMEATLSKKLEIDDIRIAPWAVRVRPGNGGAVRVYADEDEIKATHGKTRSVLTENYVMSIRSRYAHISTLSLYVVFRPTDTGGLDVRVRQLQPLPENSRGILV
jgi:hypothetical protein